MCIRYGVDSVSLWPTFSVPLWIPCRSSDDLLLRVALAYWLCANGGDPWAAGLLLFFPPLHLLTLLLHRVRAKGLHILVVALDSHSTRWYLDLVQMAVRDLNQPNTLFQAGGALVQPLPGVQAPGL